MHAEAASTSTSSMMAQTQTRVSNTEGSLASLNYLNAFANQTNARLANTELVQAVLNRCLSCMNVFKTHASELTWKLTCVDV